MDQGCQFMSLLLGRCVLGTGCRMRSLRICDVGLAPDTSHAFHSMLKVVSGRSKAEWSLAKAADADVMIAASDGDPALFSAWGASGKPVVLVIDDRGSWPPAPFVLRHPFRVMQLLSILDDVAEQYHPTSSIATVDREAWAAAESLRQCMSHAGGADWYCARGVGHGIVWVGRGSAYADIATQAALREHGIGRGTFAPANAPSPEARPFPLCDLAWFVGLHCGDGLSPWLAADGGYRLRRWPDFGRVGVTTGLLELCAYATTRAWTPAMLALATGQPLVDVHRFLNAASLAGLLVVTHAGNAEAPASRNSDIPGGWRRLLGGLRRRLGLTA